ncbi:MAG: methylated-DNA--[protein]-cysteine S-methyltransferase [Betaproteobacteria bacterium]|nr:methylated-DNA--[protein]-cysteine S-methyltransferase [Betaproteobacteria bacterium]
MPLTQNPAHPDAVIALPFGRMGLFCTDDVVLHLEYLPPETPLTPPSTPLCRAVAAQLSAYGDDPAYRFDLPLAAAGTMFQRRVWALLQQIPQGQTRTYGDAALELHSAARAVGQACAANPFAPVVPCHRMVAQGGLGGFAHSTAQDGYLLGIKRWLLQHEASLRSARPHA